MATAAGAREAARSAAGSRAVALSRETAVARAAIAVVGLHYADVAFLQPQPGTSAGDHLVSGLGPLAVLALFAALYPSMWAGLRASAAIALGFFALGTGLVTSGWHAFDSGPSGTDYTGLLMMVGGGVLIAVGTVTLWRTRKLDRMAWRYTRRLLIAGPALVVGFQIVAGSVLGYYATHRPESSTKGAPDLGRPYEDVTLTTTDGLKLQGWYVPSRNRAAVLVFPGRSGNKQRHTRNLVGHGYGVLLIDNRGQGESEGDPNVFGWDDETDVNAALDFLAARPDVDDQRIGGLGLSVGGETLLETAAHTDRVRALVSEGAGARTWEEDHELPGHERWSLLPFFVSASASTAVFSNTMPPESLKQLVKEIPPRPVFLIHADGEVLNDVYYRSAGKPANWDIWEVPGAKHVGGLEAQPEEYERRVIGFFDRSLLAGKPAE